ncbi:MAG: S41 family peptidase [Bacteroidales bacterium]|nr:MAG: S41 family peptidase [Bacteroidales bacterium]
MYENRKKDIIYPIVLGVVLIIGIIIGFKINKGSGRTSLLVNPKTDKLTSVLKYIEDDYVDTVGIGQLVELTLPAVLKNLDPHSIYIPAKEFQGMNEPLEGGFDGIGVQYNMPNDTVIVISPVKGGPSERLGVLSGDRIIKINGKTVAGVKFPADSIPKLLKGTTGTKVKIGVKRKGVNELIDFDIIRDKIPIYSVDVSYMPSNDIGYIKINTFSKTTYQEFLKANEKLKGYGMKKLIVDLRGNTGGYMDAATNIADEFLDSTRLIVYTQGKSRSRQNIYSNPGGECINEKVIILIDEFAASASEILAGAIQDNDRGTIIGRRSFGKGLVQEQVYFKDGSALRLTTARYYTPSGRSIQKPYSSGNDDNYFNDISNRFQHGEFQQVDSIKFTDSLKYYTSKGRIVYGGGGIMPDVFIPLDTNGISPYLTKVANRNLIYRFAFDFTERHRNEVRGIKEFESVKNYLNGFNLLSEFIAFAERNGIPANQRQISHSKLIIETQIKAVIARNIIDEDGFYPFILEIDETLKKAIEYFNKKELSSEEVSMLSPKLSIQGWIRAQLKTTARKDLVSHSA